MNQFSMLEPCPSSFSGRDGSAPLATSKTKNTEETCLRVDFQCSRVIFNVRTYVRKIYVRKWNRDSIWKVARKRKSWTSLNYFVA